MSPNLSAVVVDDEPLARDELIFLLSQCADTDVIGQAGDSSQALELCESLRPDVLFADLRMPGPDGISLAEAVHRRYPQTQVVIVSAHEEGAVRAFEAQIADYLLKPVRLVRLQHTLERLRVKRPIEHEKLSAPLDRVAVRRGGSYVVLDVADVVYFEMRDELAWAVTPQDRFALDLSLAQLEQRLSTDDYFRSHRGYIVRVDRILAIEPQGASTYELLLDHPQSPRIPLARERARLLRQRIPFTG